MLKSIEKVSESSLLSDGETAWALFDIAEFTPRAQFYVAPLNDTEIVLMGGYFGTKDLSEVWILDTNTDNCNQVVLD